MRVTHIITRLVVGGAQENTLATVLGLRGKPGIEVSLVAGPTRGPEGTLETLVSGVPGLLTVVPSLVRPLNPWLDVLATAKLTRLLRRSSPDIVHTHSGKAGVLGRLAARRAGVPIIIHTVHGPSFGDFQGSAANWLFRRAERLAARHTTHFITVAEAMTRQYLAAGIGHPGQYTRILSGFPVTRFASASNDPNLRAQLSLAPEDVVVGMIARLFKLKGHDDLLEVAPALVRRCPQVKFLWIGDGPWRARLEQRIGDLALESRFRFAGLVAPEEVPRYVGIMDLLVHLSRREGLPRALPQALAAGKPVIAYDCDGAGEVCLEGRTGFLVALGDLNGLTERLARLAVDGVMREHFGRLGQRWVLERFSEEQMVEEIHGLYQRLFTARRQP